MKQPDTATPAEPSMGVVEYSTYELHGQVDNYDVDGSGTCLTTVLIAYATDCRKAATNHQELAAALLVEAARAEAAATAAEYADLEKPTVQP